MKMLSWVLACLSAKMQTFQTAKTTPNVPIKGKSKALKNVAMPSPKPSSDIRTSFKITENEREQVAPENGNIIPSNDIKSDLAICH